jgi:probable rRNA maturation factor
VDDAAKQAGEFQTTWRSEIVRYVVHGVLHLLGHDDLEAGPRRKMKRAENRLVRRLEAAFPVSKL